MEDTSPSLDKVQYDAAQNSYLIRNIRGLRMQARRRLDDTGGFEVNRIGPYRITAGATILISDPTVLVALKPQALVQLEGDNYLDLAFTSQSASSNFTIKAAMASFGPHAYDSHLYVPLPIIDIASGSSNEHSCRPFDAVNAVVVARRGVCTFAVKMDRAGTAGAAAVLVLSDEEELLVPSGDDAATSAIETQIPLLLVPKSAAGLLMQALRVHKDLKMQVLPSQAEARQAAWLQEVASTPVIVNGHWLVNCKIVPP